jgi:hypothetical protein
MDSRLFVLKGGVNLRFFLKVHVIQNIWIWMFWEALYQLSDYKF